MAAERTAPPLDGLPRLAWGALVAGFAAQIAGGYAVAFGFHTALFAWHQDPTAEALWGSAAFPPEAAAYRHWFQAVMGATLAAWATTALWLAVVPLRRGERWAWWAITTSLVAWWPVDTVLSAADGVWINVAFNTVALVGMAGPLAVLWGWLPRLERDR